MTSEISAHLTRTHDKIIGNSFRQDHLKIPIPPPRHERYIQQHPLSVPLSQTSIQKQNIRGRSTFTQPKMPSVTRDTFGHIKSDNYGISEDSKRYKGASEHISDQL